MRQVKEVYGDKLQLTWRSFVLEQQNTKEEDPEFRIWERSDYPSRGLGAFRAVEAARRQGDEAFDRMRYALLEGRHEHRKDFREMEDIEGLAQEAGLDMDQFRKDVADPNILDLVAKDHAKAQELAVFGTPTFVFENGEKFFLRIKAPDNSEQAARTFDGLYKVFVEQPNIDEVKRPHKVD